MELPNISFSRINKALTAALHPEKPELYEALTEEEKPWCECLREEIEENRRKGLVVIYDIPCD